MELIDERIAELSENYGVEEELIRSYLNILLEYPFISNGDEDMLFLCLARIVSEVCTQNFLAETIQSRKNSKLFRSLNEIFSEMILRTYADEAFLYLNDKFLKHRNISVEPNYEYDETMSDTEREYQGYGGK